MISYLALLVVLSGTAYAATKLPANSVGTKQLKNKAVTLNKISPKAQRALKGRTGPQGPKGDAGQNAARITRASVSLTASPAPGTTQTLLIAGPVNYTANCLDQGGGQFRLEIRAQSTQPGLTEFSRFGFLDLTSTPQLLWFVFGPDSSLSRIVRHLIMSPTKTLQLADVTFAIHKPGYGDCFAGIDVTTP